MYSNSMNNKLIVLLIAVLLLTSCDDLFEPAIENNRDLEDAYGEATYAEGLLLNGYLRIPTLNHLELDSLNVPGPGSFLVLQTSTDRLC